ncbi:MAG: OB-fold nucleic acid binding domain-containing protein, partial [Candidatus Limnocylindrales bacterium]
GIVTGVRMVVTKARATMAIVSLEDLQGSIEVVIFPRLYEETRGTWTEGRILLVAGRIDHKGEEVSLLADLAVDWDEAVGRGPEAFAREVAGADRSRGRTGRGGNGNVPWNGSANGRPSVEGRPPVAVGPGPRPMSPVPPAVAAVGGASGPSAPVSPLRSGPVSPLRAGGAGPEPGSYPPSADGTSAATVLPRIVPAEPVPLDLEPEDLARLGPDDDEPPLPDEASALVAEAAAAPTAPLEAGADQVLHVRFSGGTGTEGAMEAFRQVIRSHPGATRVVIHLPGGRSGAALPMELRSGVAYDAELLAEVRRRLGPSAVELHLA